MLRVIVNSTPLIVLSNIGRLDLLHQLYGDIIIPQAVFDEVTQKEDSACNQIRTESWIHTEQIHSATDRRMFQAKLHAGEVEVMQLAQENPTADLVVLDDNAAKKTAKFLGLTVTGTLGILLKAKARGIIEYVMPLLSQIQANGFYISDEVLALVRAEAKE